MLRDVRLYGKLGARYGRHHRFEVATPAEAVRALIANYPALEKELNSAHQRGVGYKVFVGDAALEKEDQLRDPSSARETIRIAPWVIGRGDGKAWGQIFLGAVLIAASFWIPGLAPWAAQALFGLGLSMALGGVVQLLSPVPKAGDPNERPENKPSFLFDGPVNTTAQGQCVPWGFGEMIIGSAVISVGITADDVPV